VTIDPLRDLSFAIAYRMLGTVSEAEDVVQEALLRLHSAEGVENREAFLTTVTTRLAIDVLRSARVRRETYTGAWLPEPLVEDDATRRVEDEETISLAFLVLLERLTPDERAVLVLRDSFDYSFAEIGEVLGKSEQNCRQILSRARRRIGEERPRFDADPEQRRTLAARFLAAAREGDIEGLVAVLAPRRRPRRRRRRQGARAAQAAGRRRGNRPCVRRLRAHRRRVGGHGRAGARQRPARLPDARARRAPHQRHLDRRGRRRGPAHPLDAQPGQARPPRPALGPGPEAVGAVSRTPTTPATSSAGSAWRRHSPVHAQHHVTDPLPPPDGSLPSRGSGPRDPPPRGRPRRRGVVS
jgi:RNA polymerase sigma factor (sigma-70 family)